SPLIKLTPVYLDGIGGQPAIKHIIIAIITAAVCRSHPERAELVGPIELIKRRTICQRDLICINRSIGLVISSVTSRSIGDISKVNHVSIYRGLLPLIECAEDGQVAWTRIGRDGKNRSQCGYS